MAEGSRAVAEGSRTVTEASRAVVEGFQAVTEGFRPVVEASRAVAEGKLPAPEAPPDRDDLGRCAGDDLICGVLRRGRAGVIQQDAEPRPHWESRDVELRSAPRGDDAVLLVDLGHNEIANRLAL